MRRTRPVYDYLLLEQIYHINSCVTEAEFDQWRMINNMKSNLKYRKSIDLYEAKTSHLNNSMRFEPNFFIFESLESAHWTLQSQFFQRLGMFIIKQ